MHEKVSVEFDYGKMLRDFYNKSELLDPDPSTLSEKQVLEKNYKFYKMELSDYTKAFDYCPDSSNYYDYLLDMVVSINDKIDEIEKLLNGKL